jgi:putative ATPase
MAIEKAQAVVRDTGNLPVPLHIRNAPTKLMKDLGYHKDYKYAHSFEGNFVKDILLPEEIKGMKFYEPGKNSREEEIRKRLDNLWKGIYDYDI